MMKLLLLCWKSAVFFRRRWISSIFTVLFPALTTIFLLVIRSKTPRIEVPFDTTWPNFSINHLPTVPSSHWIIAYSPDCVLSSNIINQAATYLSATPFSLPSEKELVTYLQNCTYGCAGVVFHNCSDYTNIAYSIRVHSRVSWDTSLLFRRFPTPGPRSNGSKFAEPPHYIKSGFLALQKAVDSAIIDQTGKWLNVSLPYQVEYAFKRLPYPAHLEDMFSVVISQQLSILIVVGYLFPVASLIKRILAEKNTRMKESVRMMGVSSMTYWSSWFVPYGLLFTLSAACLTGVLCADFGVGGKMLARSSPSFIFCSMALYSFALISFTFALSTLFSSTNGGTAITCAILVLTFTPYQLMSLHFENYHLISKLAFSVMPNIAIGFLCLLIGRFEGVGSGAQWHLFAHQASSDDALRFDLLWSVLFADTLLYLLLAWYIDNVWPGKYGVPKPWYFPITGLLHYRTAFFGHTQRVGGSGFVGPLRVQDSGLPVCEGADGAAGRSSDAPGLVGLKQPVFEPPPVGLCAGITTHNLYKNYSTANRITPAVDDVTMSAYEGQITVLIGRNGAGKTTLMSMLTGLIRPSSGTAFVNGHSISSDIQAVRKSLGFCPQHDLLFDHLTVFEHLWFFAKLKGCGGKESVAQVNSILSQVRLKQKAGALAHTLSGGAKRRLSVGMALIGNSRVVILDEPTAGLDPSARRQIWDILVSEKANRTVLVSTHYMDEAEYLGDRIAIMSDGKLCCLGSPFFLKSVVGTGYTLTLTLTSEARPDEIVATVKQYVLATKQQSCDGAELKLLLPVDAVHTFGGLFALLESQGSMLGISSFGVSVTTMEEVFFKVAAQIKVSDESTDWNPPTEVTETFNCESASNNTGCLLYCQQIFALTYKRFAYFKRMPLLALGQFVVPLLCTLMAHLVYKDIYDYELYVQPPLLLSLRSFFTWDRLVVPAVSEQDPPSLLTAYSEQFDPRSVSVEVIKNASALESEMLRVATENIHAYVTNYITALIVNATSVSTKSVEALVYFMGESLHALPAALNTLSNGILRLYPQSNITIETYNHPLPTSSMEVLGELMSERTWINVIVSGVTVGIDTLMGVAFLAASLVLCLIHERSSNAKHLQFISGVRLSTYWLTMYIWDALTFAASSLLVIIVFAFFNLEPFHRGDRLCFVCLLFASYGWSIIPLMYLLSAFFTSAASGLVWLCALNALSGVIGTIIVQALSLPSIGQQWLGLRLRYLLIALSPNFAFSDGLYSINANFEYNRLCTVPGIELICADAKLGKMPCCLETCDPYCAHWSTNYLSMDTAGIGFHLVSMGFQGALFLLLVVFCDTTLAHRLWRWIESGRK
uniref:ABC transporter domain-containing protein n=1 Tax=Mesocestoides corti TaxID=53468 RepID=A0A5K3F685_MESCO